MTEEKHENENEIEKLIFQDELARQAYSAMTTAWYVGLVVGAVSFVALGLTKWL